MKRALLLLAVAFGLAVPLFGQGGTGGGGGASLTSYTQVTALWSSCSGTQYLGFDGNCHTAAGSGTVTSVVIAGTANQISAGGTCSITSSGTCTLTLANAVFLGTDNSAAGTLQLSNGSANAHTIWGSAATTSNTILGFATAPVTGDLVDCVVSSTTCTLTDSGVLAANVVTASGTLTSGALLIGGGSKATSALADGSQYNVMVMGALNPGWGQVNLAQSGAVTGVLGTGNLPGSGVTTVNGQTCTLGSSCNVETATSGQVAISGGSGAALTGAADLTYSTHTFSTTANGIFDFHAATGTAAFKVPSNSSNTATAAGVIDFDTTGTHYHVFDSGADDIVCTHNNGECAGSGTMSDGSGSTTAGYFPDTTTSAHVYAVDTNLDDGHTASNTLTYGGSGGITASNGPVTSTGPSGDAGMFALAGNTANQTIPANKFAWGGFSVTNATAYGLQPSNTAPSGNQVLVFGTPTSGWTQGAWYSLSGSGTTLCLTTSCVMTTPNLGTPSAATLTNATGLPVSGITSISANTVVANVTGSSAAPTAASIPSGIQNYVAGTGYNQATAHQMAAPKLCADSSGSGTAQSCTTSPSQGSLTTGDTFIYTTTTTNSGTGLTVNIDSIGAKSVAIPGSSGWTTTLTANIIPANKPLLLSYDGTNLNVQQTGTAASGGGSFNGTVTYTSSQTAGTADSGKLVIMNCSAACAYTLPATQPSTTWQAWVMTVGTTNATIALGGSDTFNGSTSVPILNQYRTMFVAANTATSTDYKGDAPLIAGGGVSLIVGSNGLEISPVFQGVSAPTTATNFGSNLTSQQIWPNEFFVAGEVSFYVYQSTAGVGCSTASNTVQPTIAFTDAAGNAQTLAGPTLTISGNGAVGAASGTFVQGGYHIVGNNSGSTVTFTTSSTLASTGCSTTPKYIVIYGFGDPT